ncbi:MAG: AAA family ATPase [Anaeromyxobacteraceae bacterium]
MADAGRPLPPWADELRRRYLSGEAWQFVLHGNVHDLVAQDGKLVPLPEFLCEVLLAPTKDLVLRYDVSSGVRVVKGPGARVSGAAGTGAQDGRIDELTATRAPGRVLPALERLLLSADRIGAVLEYAETIAPAAETSFASDADRASVVALHRWSMSPVLEEADNLVLVVTETLADLHPRLVANPRTATLRLPLPDEAGRREALRIVSPGLEDAFAARLTELTAGLKLVQVKAVLEGIGATGGGARAPGAAALPREAQEAALAEVARRKREIIERECSGLVEFVEPKHDFSAVGGIEAVKAELSAVAENLREGRRARCPMGILFTGPMGTGKTFVAEAFAREARMPAVKLKNFRSKWVGATEGNLERILAVVQAMGPVIVIIDEGDRTLGGEEGETDGGTSSRVIARLKEFMSDGSNRGRVLFLLMTNRPDKLDIDIKRAGRLDRKIPFFPPQTPEEVEPVLLAQLRRHRIPNAVEFPRDRAAVSAPLAGYSNAELEQVVLLAGERAGDQPATAAHLAEAARDFLPSRDREMLEYMELVAVFEASSRRLLPTKWAELPADELQARLLALRARIGGRR